MPISYDGLDKEQIEQLHLNLSKVGGKEMQEAFEEVNDLPNKNLIQDPKVILKGIFNALMNEQEMYFEDSYENNLICALWIIGTHIYKVFPTFPYLQFNATKGSGKTRKLNFLKNTCWNAEIMVSLTEAVLFRTAASGTIILDECESIATKEKGALRELFNGGYKKGSVVKRMRKIKTDKGEEQKVDSFNLYAPKALANINGMEDVLADRMIPLIMDKSDNPLKVNLMADFDSNQICHAIKRALEWFSGVWCSEVELQGNSKVSLHHDIYIINTLTTLTTLTTPVIDDKGQKCVDCTNSTYQNNIVNRLLGAKDFLTGKNLYQPEDLVMQNWELNLFEKSYKANIHGRQFELFFPLFYIANMIDATILDEIIRVARLKTHEKKIDDTIENKDVALLDFVSRKEQTLKFHPIAELTFDFKQYFSGDDENYINTRWMGKALKRLNIIIEKRKMSRGFEVVLNIAKAREKIKMFKTEDDKDG